MIRRKFRHRIRVVFVPFLAIFLAMLVIEPSLASVDSSQLIKLDQNTLVFLNKQHVQYKVKPSFEKVLIRNYLHHYYFPWDSPLASAFSLDMSYVEHNAVN